jgi:hypothetical protein
MRSTALAQRVQLYSPQSYLQPRQMGKFNATLHGQMVSSAFNYANLSCKHCAAISQ